MKFDFKKITSVLASVVMLGSTIGIAAAANYPAPFVAGGSADVAVIVGASAANSDYVAAVDLGSDLSSELTSQTAAGAGTTSTASGGDSVSIVGPGSDYINLDEGWGDVYSLEIDKNDMPNLLADGTYRNGENTEYDYKQTLKFDGNLSATFFADSDYKDKEPTLGYQIAKNDRLLNYTLTFKKDVKSDVTTSNTLDDLENTDISMLGINYRIVDAHNISTGTYLTLLGGSLGGSINLDEEKTETLNGKDYVIKLTYVGTETSINKVQFDINGERTNKLAKGEIYKLSDGISIGVKDISYQNFAGGVMSAEYTLGASKLKIEDGQKLEVNDEDVDGITCYITHADSAGKQSVSDIALRWVADDEYFLTPASELTMPGLESVKLSMGEFYFPEEEDITITYDGTDSMELKAPIEDGVASISILYGSDGLNWTLVGQDSTGQLATQSEVNNTGGNTYYTTRAYQNLSYNESTDQYFVVSYNTTTASESYLVSLKTKSSDGKNYSTFKNEVTGISICTDVETAKTCKIGNSVITVEKNMDQDAYEIITTSGNSRFDRLYTAEGLEIQLPWLNETTIHQGAVTVAQLACNNTASFSTNEVLASKVVNATCTAAQCNFPCYENKGKYDLVMIETDKDGYLGKGRNFNTSLGWTGTKTTVTSVSEDDFAGAKDLEIGSTNVYVGYMKSKLATKSEFDTDGTQDFVKYTYHGGESYAPLFVAAPAVTVTAGGEGATTIGSTTVKDTEITSTDKAKNLIVIGGSCINSVAASLLDVSAGTCEDDFTTATGVGAGQFLIQVVDSPYTTGKVAMLVAGYEKEDTTKAVKYLTTETVATSVGTKLKKVTETYVDVA